MEYNRPITADFTAVAESSGLKTWEKFVAGLRRKGRGRLSASSVLFLRGEVVANFVGQFVAIET